MVGVDYRHPSSYPHEWSIGATSMISKKILSSLFKTQGTSVNEALSTLMAEVEAIMILPPLKVEFKGLF